MFGMISEIARILGVANRRITEIAIWYWGHISLYKHVNHSQVAGSWGQPLGE